MRLERNRFFGLQGFLGCWNVHCWFTIMRSWMRRGGLLSRFGEMVILVTDSVLCEFRPECAEIRKLSFSESNIHWSGVRA